MASETGKPRNKTGGNADEAGNAGSEAERLGPIGTLTDVDGASGAIASGVAENARNVEADDKAEQEPRRRRGRPRGENYKPRKPRAASTDSASSEKVDLGQSKPEKRPPTKEEIFALSKIYMLANNAIAASNNAKDFVITEQEAETIAEPLAECLAEWGIYVSGAGSPYAKLIVAGTTVYAGRVVGRMMVAQMQKQQRQQETPSRPSTPSSAIIPSPVISFEADQENRPARKDMQ